MNPCEVVNLSPFAVQPLLLMSEDGRDALVLVVKASLAVLDNGRRVALAEEQAPIRLSTLHNGDPGMSSVRFALEAVPVKPATDIILIGHAHAPKKDISQMDVTLRVGPIHKMIRAFGDRYWLTSMGMQSVTRPLPFERIPLTWEFAFGGRDETSEAAPPAAFEPRNPVGVGFHGEGSRFRGGAKLPNLEMPSALIRRYEDRPTPAGFGFVAEHWEPRCKRAGTYDPAWQNTRCPLLPADFDTRFYNAAPDDQVVSGYLTGDEPVELLGASREGRWAFSLPGFDAPVYRVMFSRRSPVEGRTVLDTVLIDADSGMLSLTWRASVDLFEPPHEVRTIEVTL